MDASGHRGEVLEAVLKGNSLSYFGEFRPEPGQTGIRMGPTGIRMHLYGSVISSQEPQPFRAFKLSPGVGAMAASLLRRESLTSTGQAGVAACLAHLKTLKAFKPLKALKVLPLPSSIGMFESFEVQMSTSFFFKLHGPTSILKYQTSESCDKHICI